MPSNVTSNRLVGKETSTGRDAAVSLGGSLTLIDNVLSGSGNSITIIKKKLVNEDVTNSTVFQDDDDLFIDVLNGENWVFNGFLIATANGTKPDLKFLFSGPTGNFFLSWRREQSTQGDLISALLGESGKIDLTTSDQVISFIGHYDPTADGTFQLEWAQNTSDADFTRLKIGSFLLATREA